MVDGHSSRLLVLDRWKLHLWLVVHGVVGWSYPGLVTWELEVEERRDLRLLMAVESLLSMGLRVEEMVDRNHLGLVLLVIVASDSSCLVGLHRLDKTYVKD